MSTMTTSNIIMGWTKSDQTDETYRPLMDGYRVGADQHELELTIVTSGATTDEILEAAFAATNAPGHLAGLSGLIQGRIAQAGYRGAEAGHYSLSVGDTVTLNGVRYAVERMGWTKVA